MTPATAHAIAHRRVKLRRYTPVFWPRHRGKPPPLIGAPKTMVARAFQPGPIVPALRNREHLTRMNQVRVGDAAGLGDHLILAAVAVEAFRDRPQGVSRDDRVCPRSGRRWRGRRRLCSGCWFGWRGRRLFGRDGNRFRCWRLGSLRWRRISLSVGRPRWTVEAVQHEVAVVLQKEPNILGALGIRVPDRLVRCVEYAVAVRLHLK